MDMLGDNLAGSAADQVSEMANQDAFEESSGPIIYMTDNRTPAVVELRSALIYIIYLSFVLAILLILPGVRRTKFKSFFCMLTLLTVGGSILLAMDGSHWLVGRVSIRNLKYSSLAQHGETISGQLEVNVGLSAVNVSLSGLLELDRRTGGAKRQEDRLVMYNERFSWAEPEAMIREHKAALVRGLPHPILTITEYLSHDADGFNWSRRLREAGHFSSMLLCAALLCWLLASISLCVLPSLLAALTLIMGILMMASVGVYALLIPSKDSLAIRMMGGQLVEFQWGFNYIATHVVGLLTILAGLVLFVMQELSDPGELFTIMESEQNAIDRKALCGLASQFRQQSDGKPCNAASNRLANLLIGSSYRAPAMRDLESAGKQQQTNPTGSVIIPISDIEKNFGPSAN